MQVSFNTRQILPTSYEGKNGIGFNTTIFAPEQYQVRIAKGASMPEAQIKAVLEQAAENAEQVEIQFLEGQTKFGKYFEVYGVKLLKPEINK